MADERIDQLTPAGTLTGTELLVVADPGTGEMFKAPISDLPAPSTPTLQAVTDAGATSDKDVTFQTVTANGMLISQGDITALAGPGVHVFCANHTGGTASGGSMRLNSTSSGTKGKIYFGNSAYDEVNNRMGIGTNAPTQKIDVVGTDPVALIRSGSAETATLRLAESTTGSATFEGVYLKNKGVGNSASLGVHNVQSTNTTDDVDVLDIDRSTGNATFNKDLSVMGRQPGGLFNQTTVVVIDGDGTSVKDPVGAGVGLLRLPAGALVAGALFKIRHILKLTSGASDQNFTYKLRETSGADIAVITVLSGVFAINANAEIETLILVKSVASGTATVSARTCMVGAPIDSGFSDTTMDATTFHNLSIEIQFAGDGDGQQVESKLLLLERVF